MFRKILIALGVLAILFVLGLVGIFFYIKQKINSVEFRNLVTTRIEEATGRSAALGNFGFSLMPLSLTIEDVALKEKSGDQDFIALKKLDVLIHLRKRELEKLILNQPEIQVIQYADGTFNFSDLLGDPGEAGTEAGPEETKASEPASSGPALKGPMEVPDFNIALVQIDRARLNYTQVDAEGGRKTFAIPDLSLSVRDISMTRSIGLDLGIQIGQQSRITTALKLSPLKTLPPDIGNLEIELDGSVQVGDFRDLELFLSPEQLASLPVTKLDLNWKGKGSPSKGFQLDIQCLTPAVDERNQLRMDLNTRVDLQVPAGVFQQLLYGDAAALQPTAPTDLDGEFKLQAVLPKAVYDSLNRLYLRTHINTKNLQFQKSVLDSLDILVEFKEGRLTLAPLKLQLYEGSLDGKANMLLSAFPVTYNADFTLHPVNLNKVLAAHMENPSFYGDFSFRATAEGSGFTVPNLRNSLISQGEVVLKNGKSIGNEGSLLDQVILRFEEHLAVLSLLLPKLATRVEQARTASTASTETAIEDFILAYNLEAGKGHVSRLQLGTPDYKLTGKGTFEPFDDHIRLETQMTLSEGFTLSLTDGKDISDTFETENGGLVFPVNFEGAFDDFYKNPRPDLSRMISTAAKRQAGQKITDLLGGGKSKDAAGEEKPSKSKDVKDLLGGKKLGGFLGQ